MSSNGATEHYYRRAFFVSLAVIIGMLGYWLVSLDDRIDDIVFEVRDVESTSVQNRQDIASLTISINTLSGSVDNLSGSVTGLTDTVNELVRQQAELTGRINR